MNSEGMGTAVQTALEKFDCLGDVRENYMRDEGCVWQRMCLFSICQLCGKYYRPIKVQCYLANYVSLVPGLNLLEL